MGDLVAPGSIGLREGGKGRRKMTNYIILIFSRLRTSVPNTVSIPIECKDGGGR